MVNILTSLWKRSILNAGIGLADSITYMLKALRKRTECSDMPAASVCNSCHCYSSCSQVLPQIRAPVRRTNCWSRKSHFEQSMQLLTLKTLLWNRSPKKHGKRRGSLQKDRLFYMAKCFSIIRNTMQT